MMDIFLLHWKRDQFYVVFRTKLKKKVSLLVNVIMSCSEEISFPTFTKFPKIYDICLSSSISSSIYHKIKDVF